MIRVWCGKFLCALGLHFWVSYDEHDSWFSHDVRCGRCNARRIFRWWE